MATRNVALVFGLVLLQSAFIKDTHGQFGACNIDLCFIVDRSGSICDSDQKFNFQWDETCGNWADIVNFIHDLVSNLNIGPFDAQVALVTFSDSAEVAWGLSTYADKTSLLRAIDSLEYRKGGTTDMTGGLELANRVVFNTPDDRPQAGNVAIIITDGKPTVLSTVPNAINFLQDSGCRMLVVGITDYIDEDTLKMLSSPPHQPGKTYFFAANYSTVSVVSKSLEDQTCPQPSTVQSPLAVNCPNVQDLVIVLDGSGSICDSDSGFVFRRDKTCKNWAYILQFLHDVIDHFIISPVATRVALILFSNDARLVWGLDAYTDKATLLYAIDNLQYVKGGTTNMTGALKVLNSGVFTPQLNRPNVMYQTAIIVTDGKPTVPSTVEAAVKAVHDSGIRCLVVGVTNQADNYTLKLLSSDPKKLGETYFFATDYRTIDDEVTAQLIASACTSTSTSTTPAPEPTTTFCDPFEKLDLAFVVDGSGSICNDTYPLPTTCVNWNYTRQFISDVVSALTRYLRDIRVGMIVFSSKDATKVLWNLTNYTTALKVAIESLRYDGGETWTALALNLLTTQMFVASYNRPDAKKKAIIITDGFPTNYTTVPAAIDAVHAAGIKTIVVGIGNKVNETILKELSSPPQQENEDYFSTPDFFSLGTILDDLVKETCLQ